MSPDAGTGDDAEVQAAKRLVWDLWSPIRVVGGGSFVTPDPGRYAGDVAFHGPAPIGAVVGRDALFERVHRPLALAFPTVVRVAQVFLGGRFDGALWVAETGHLVGRPTAPWCRIPPDRVDGPPQGDPAPVPVRYGEFHRVVDGRIVEVRCLYDVLGYAAALGHRLLPPFAGRPEPPPGPVLDNGIALEPQDPATSAETLRLVEDMLGGCNRLDERGLVSMGMAAYWHDDMRWYGPWGVGATHGFDEFQTDAQGPSVASFPDRRGGHHRARIADGLTAAFTGWPSLRGTFRGEPFRGIQPTGGPIGQNIMDFYVRRDDRLHENWVLIDLIDFAAQCGVDLLADFPEEDRP
ncbi:MAG: ester cyclase [Actinomycetota bacterium]